MCQSSDQPNSNNQFSIQFHLVDFVPDHVLANELLIETEGICFRTTTTSIGKLSMQERIMNTSGTLLLLLVDRRILDPNMDDHLSSSDSVKLYFE